MPYLAGYGKSFHYAEHMKSEDFSLLHSRDHSAAFQRAVEQLWLSNVLQNAGELIQGLRDSGQFEEVLSDLDNPDPDYETAASEHKVHIVDGVNDVFYFKWDDFSSVDISAHDDAMIDFLAFAEANGLDLNFVRFDPETDEVIALNSDRGQELAAQTNALEVCLENTMLADGSDVHEFLLNAANALGMTELAEKLKTGNMRKLYEAHINTQFTSSQSNDDARDAAKNACDYFGIETDDFRRDALEHWAVTQDFAARLQGQNENVQEVLGFQIWGRTTSGQAVHIDHCVEQTFIHGYPYLMDEFVEKNMPEVAQRIQAEVEHQAELQAQQERDNAPGQRPEQSR